MTEPPQSVPPLFIWEHVDRRLVMLKMTDLVIEMKEKIDAEERRIWFENRLNANSAAGLHQLLEMKERYADETASRIYQIYCEVWKTQGFEKSPAFIRTVYNRAIVVSLRARTSSIKSQLSMWARRTAFNQSILNAHLASIDLRMRRLQDKWFRKMEVEAKELEHKLRVEGRARALQPPKPHPRALAEAAPSAASGPPDPGRRQAILRKLRSPETYTFLSVPEAAEHFGVMVRTIHRWTAEGKLTRGGRRGAITVESIRKWEAKRSRKRSP